MGHSMRKSLKWKLMLLSVWTVCLLAGLKTVDYLMFGPELPVGWVRVNSLDSIPKEAGPKFMLKFLPDSFVWPPKAIYYRVGAKPGWWFNFTRKNNGEVVGWLGFGEERFPDDLRPLEDCLSGENNSCPSGWQVFSRRLDPTSELHCLARSDFSEAFQILEGFKVTDE